MASVKKRGYRSPRRLENAAETRRRILQSARKLFVTKGYGGAKIGAIAKEAGVAPQTVYAGFESKRGILFALLDDMAVNADMTRMRQAVTEATGDPRRQLRETVGFTARLFTNGIELIDIARTVSGVEPDLGAMWKEGEGRRHRAVGQLIAEWKKQGRLRPGLSPRDAADIWWALSGPDMFRLLVVERRWSLVRFEAWLTETLEAQLFGKP